MGKALIKSAGVKVSISEAYEVAVEYEIYDPDDKEWYDDWDIFVVYKAGGRWFIFPDFAF